MTPLIYAQAIIYILISLSIFVFYIITIGRILNQYRKIKIRGKDRTLLAVR